MRSPSLAALLLLAAVGSAAAADDKAECQTTTDPDAAITRCTAAIGRDDKDAAAYYSRGKAFGLKGEADRAIADYDKAIELKPDYRAAYDSRGLAYVTKGDYVRALADVSKAGELGAKAKPGPKADAVVTTKVSATMPQSAGLPSAGKGGAGAANAPSITHKAKAEAAPKPKASASAATKVARAPRKAPGVQAQPAPTEDAAAPVGSLLP